MLKEAFRKIIRFLEGENIEYLLIGGIAVSVLGEPRVTGDIDINIKNLKRVLLKEKIKSKFSISKQIFPHLKI